MQIKRFLKYGFSVWEDHPDHIGSYQVSVGGEVRGIRNGEMSGLWKLFHSKWKNVEISNGRGNKPEFVRLYFDGKFMDKQVQDLVLETFDGPCPDKMACYHLDGNASNNSVENLSWKTKMSVGS